MRLIALFLVAAAACGDDTTIIDPMCPDAGAMIDARPDAPPAPRIGVRYVCTIQAYQDPPPGPTSTDTVCAPANNFDLASDRAADANEDHVVLGCVDTQYTCPL